MYDVLFIKMYLPNNMGNLHTINNPDIGLATPRVIKLFYIYVICILRRQSLQSFTSSSAFCTMLIGGFHCFEMQ